MSSFLQSNTRNGANIDLTNLSARGRTNLQNIADIAIDKCRDVDLTGLMNSNVIAWNSSLNKWLPVANGGGGGGNVSSVNTMTGDVILNVDDLNNVNISSVQDNNVLLYNDFSNEWINGNLTTDDVNETTNNQYITEILKDRLISALPSDNKLYLKQGTSNLTFQIDDGEMLLNSIPNTQTLTINNKIVAHSVNSITPDANGNIILPTETEFKDTEFKIYKDNEPTNYIKFNLNNLTGGELELRLPNVNTYQELICDNAQQIIYNKDMLAGTNYIVASGLRFGSNDSDYKDISPFKEPVADDVLLFNGTWAPNKMDLYKMSDIDISTNLSNNDILQYDSTLHKWLNKTLPSTTTSLSNLTDVQLFLLSNYNLLIYDNTLSKWINTSFNDSFIMSNFNSSSKKLKWDLSDISLNTTRNITVPDADTTMVGTNTTQTLTNKSFIDSNTFFIDDVTNTKKLQFQLSSISANTTRTITALDANLTIVGTDTTQTLTNKNLLDNTNDCRASSIKNGTASIPISGTAVSGQWLQYDGTNMIFTNITDSTFLIQDNVDNTKKLQFQLDTLSSNTTVTLNPPSSNGTIVIGSDLQSISNDLTILGCSYPITPATIGTTYIATTLNDIKNPQMFINNSSSFLPNITNNPTGQISDSVGTTVTNLLLGQDNNSSTFYTISTALTYYRLNLSFELYGTFQADQITLTCNHQIGSGASTHTIELYGSASTQISSTSDTYTGMTKIFNGTFSPDTSNPDTYTFGVSTTSPYKYYSLRILYGGTTRKVSDIFEFRIRSAGGSYIPQYQGTNYNTSIDSSTGFPTYTRISGNTNENILINQSLSLVQSAYNRIYPVLRGINDIRVNNFNSISSSGVNGILLVDNVVQINANATQTLSNKTYNMTNYTIKEASNVAYIYNKNIPVANSDIPTSGVQFDFSTPSIYNQSFNYGLVDIAGDNTNNSNSVDFKINLNNNPFVDFSLTDYNGVKACSIGSNTTVFGIVESTNHITSNVVNWTTTGNYTLNDPNVAVIFLNSTNGGTGVLLPIILSNPKFKIGYSVQIFTGAGTSGSITVGSGNNFWGDNTSSFNLAAKRGGRIVIVSNTTWCYTVL